MYAVCDWEASWRMVEMISVCYMVGFFYSAYSNVIGKPPRDDKCVLLYLTV